MKVVRLGDIPDTAVEMQGAVGCRMRCLIGQEDGAPNFTMRHFEVAPGGHTPQHQHNYEHEVFVLEGQGEVLINGKRFSLSPETVVYVPPQAEHQFRNTGSGPLRFLCLIPHPLGKMQGPCVAACGCD